MDQSAIHITRWGHAGPRVILVHGGAQGSEVGGERNFSAQRALADRRWQLVVPDRPGHGRSPDPGRPRIAAEVQELIPRFAAENAWGARKIHTELEKLGFTVGLATVSRSLAKRPPVRQKPQSWRTFLRNHRDGIVAMDFFAVSALAAESSSTA